MFGLGKSRTKFGKWIDRKGIDQIDVEDASKLSRRTVSRMCNDKDYSPKYTTFAKLKRGLKKLGYEKDYDDFWI